MATQQGKLLLIDVMPLLYRGHFAFISRPRLTAAGINTSAIFVLTNLVTQILEEDGATHAALAMDTSPTFRHEKFPDYKAQREKLPEDIGLSIPMTEEFAAAMNLPFLKVEGFEADDVIGTLATLGESAGMSVDLYTPDKDFAQLVTPNITLCRPGKAGETERFGVDEVCAEWQLDSPGQMIDLLGLAGDASDNIPGIPGVGPKTAVKLLRQFGDLESVLANADALKGKLGERVAEHAEDARISRWLAAIRKDVPVRIAMDDLRLREPNPAAMLEFCDKYELRALASKMQRSMGDSPSAKREAAADPKGQMTFAFFSENAPAEKERVAAAASGNDEAATIYTRLDDIEHNYKLCDSPEAIDELIETLASARLFAFDTETSGLDPWESRIVGISFCAKAGEAAYVPLPESKEEAEAILQRFKAVFENPGIIKVGHNLKFDLSMLRHAGVEVAGPLRDTLLAHYVLDPTDRHGMDHLARALLDYETIPIVSLLGERGKDQLTMDLLPASEVADYAAEDADVTLRLYEKLSAMVEEAGAGKALDDCDNALVPVLLDMETEGVRIDTRALELYGAELAMEIESLESRILQTAGLDFNIASPKQLGEVLFDHLGLPSAGKTRTGQYTTTESALLGLKGQHPIIELVLEFRSCSKLKSTYVDKLPTYVRSATGRVHTSFNQALTETGRLSSDNPNLQNIPIRTERGRRIRQAFLPRDEKHVLLSADYSQVELRVMAALSEDPAMVAAFKADADIHTETAARVHGIDAEYVTKDMREQAKMVNFGIIYGISAFGLGQRLGIPRGQAAELIETYFKLYPNIKTFTDRVIETAREEGGVRTLLGRVRPLRDINSRNGTLRAAAERLAINTPIQGTAADIIKLAMIAIHRELLEQNLRARLVLQIHDELVLDVPATELGTVRELVARHMSGVIELAVPLKVEIGVGDNWLEAH